MLKPLPGCAAAWTTNPAAFRRLCVETAIFAAQIGQAQTQPPSGGCVLKRTDRAANRIAGQPAAFRRLCVETNPTINAPGGNPASRLQAAVC